MSTILIPLPKPGREQTLLDRGLSFITDLHAGESVPALLLTANVFLLLGSYYILKTVREALILSEAGAQVKSYSAAGQALLLLAVIPAYGFLASKVNRSKLIALVTLFFISHLGIFYLMGTAGFRIGIPFFLWVGVFNVLVIAQFWSFANDLHDTDSGRRIFPLIGVGSALGAWAGARAASSLFKLMDAYALLLVAAVGLALCILLSLKVHARSSDNAAQPIGGKGGFRLVFSDRYLLLIAAMVLLFNVVNSLGEYMLGEMVVENAKAAVASGSIRESEVKSAIGAFYGDFFGWVNLGGFLLQLLIVSRLFKYVGVRGALFVLPLIALGSYSLMAALPVLGIVRIAKIFENSTDYSIQNTARHALFLPTSRDAKYKGKAAIDTFFWRVGDMMQALVVLIGTQLAFGVRNFAQVNIGLVAVWLMVLAGIYREHRKLTSSPPAGGAGP